MNAPHEQPSWLSRNREDGVGAGELVLRWKTILRPTVAVAWAVSVAAGGLLCLLLSGSLAMTGLVLSGAVLAGVVGLIYHFHARSLVRLSAAELRTEHRRLWGAERSVRLPREDILGFELARYISGRNRLSSLAARLNSGAEVVLFKDYDEGDMQWMKHAFETELGIAPAPEPVIVEEEQSDASASESQQKEAGPKQLVGASCKGCGRRIISALRVSACETCDAVCHDDCLAEHRAADHGGYRDGRPKEEQPS